GQGSSTLTMQLSRVLFLTPEKTYERKIKEVILAFQIEKSFTKEEIFALYCNQVYFGHGNYGVEAASEFLFTKPVGQLSLAEAALVAGLPQNPSRLSPVEHPARAPGRRTPVLDRTVGQNYTPTERPPRGLGCADRGRRRGAGRGRELGPLGGRRPHRRVQGHPGPRRRGLDGTAGRLRCAAARGDRALPRRVVRRGRRGEAGQGAR